MFQPVRTPRDPLIELLRRTFPSLKRPSTPRNRPPTVIYNAIQNLAAVQGRDPGAGSPVVWQAADDSNGLGPSEPSTQIPTLLAGMTPTFNSGGRPAVAEASSFRQGEWDYLDQLGPIDLPKRKTDGGWERIPDSIKHPPRPATPNKGHDGWDEMPIVLPDGNPEGSWQIPWPPIGRDRAQTGSGLPQNYPSTPPILPPSRTSGGNDPYKVPTCSPSPKSPPAKSGPVQINVEGIPESVVDELKQIATHADRELRDLLLVWSRTGTGSRR